MNILGIFINNEMRTGANRRYIELMEGLAQRGNRVFVIMNKHLDFSPEFFTKIELDIQYTRKSFPPISYLLTKKIKSTFTTVFKDIPKIDWIHVHSDIYINTAVFLKKKLKAQLFYAVRCDDITRAKIMLKSGFIPKRQIPSSLIQLLKKYFRGRKISRFSEQIAFMNSNDRNHFLQRTNVSIDKTRVIYGNIWHPRFSDEWKGENRSSSVRKLIYVGSLSPSKGLYHLLEALASLKQLGYTDLKLYVLARTTKPDRVQRYISKLSLEEMVSLEGYKNPFPYFAECDLMIYPTLYDAWGDVVMEAIFTGCPAMASAIGGLPELLKYPELLFEPGNIRQIADRIERTITDTDFYQRMRDLCHQRIDALTFDWTEKVEEVMRKG